MNKARAKIGARASNSGVCVCVDSSSDPDPEPEQANRADQVEVGDCHGAGTDTGAGPMTPPRNTAEETLEISKHSTAASPSGFWSAMMHEAEAPKHAPETESEASVRDIETVPDESHDIPAAYEAGSKADSEGNANIGTPLPPSSLPVDAEQPRMGFRQQSEPQHVPAAEALWEEVLRLVYLELNNTVSTHKITMRDRLLPFLYKVLKESHGYHDPRTLASKALDLCQNAGLSFWGQSAIYTRRRSAAWSSCLSFFVQVLHCCRTIPSTSINNGARQYCSTGGGL